MRHNLSTRGEVFFTSDLHLGHEAAVRMCGRPFSCADEMNDTIIERINAAVGPGDTLWVLGDCSHRIGRDRAAGLLGRIRCKNMRLVRGNHDRDLSGTGLFLSVDDYAEFRWPDAGNRLFCLMHYPLLDWNSMHHGAVHLHGHIHSRGPELNEGNVLRSVLRFDVGVDANGFKPVSMEEILSWVERAEERRDLL